MGLYPMSGCANCGAHESRITCRCWCHDPKPSSADPSPSAADSVPDQAGSTGTGNQQDGDQS